MSTLPACLRELEQRTRQHQQEHGCNAHVFADGAGLWQLAHQYQPRHILELGTGLGYTACLMALASPHAQVETLEGDPEHADLAHQHIVQLGLARRVRLHQGSFATVLPSLSLPPASLDWIFFDGNMPPFILVQHFHHLLQTDGLLVCANLELNGPLGARRAKEELRNSRRWQLLPPLENGQTWVARKTDVSNNPMP